MINKKRLIKLTQDLIRIPSENPGGDERKIADFVKRYLRRLGLDTKIYEFENRRSNVVAFLKGGKTSATLLLSPHLDTVPAGSNWHFPAFGARVYRGKIYGRGATDCKANLAIALEAIESLCEENFTLGYTLIFAATADEEAGSRLGLIPLLRKGLIKPQAALVLDSDEFNIIVTQKGLIHLKFKVMGKKAHGAYPWRGINAIDVAIDIIRDIKRYRFRHPRNPYLRPPTVNIGTIRGGDKVNIVSDWCEFELDLRFLPGMSAREIIDRMRDIASRHTRRFRIEIQALQEPYLITQTNPLVKSLLKAAADLRIKSQIKGCEGATVITFFQQRNIPAVAFGCGSRNSSHATDEYVKIDNLYKGAKVLERFLKIYSLR
jgi:succinyl-diaminopimelate desuccinylase